jgi:3-isopropylmalate/(R)-2-methylmalate dehydratase small subunit
VGAQILLGRENFGCGSSREHAVWALEDAGFRVVIAPSFADIFYNNCFKNGVLPIVLDAAVMDRLFNEVAQTRGYRLQVDLDAQTITTPAGDAIDFEVDEFRKYCLLNGLDDIGLTLQHADGIKAYESRRKQTAPWLFG